VGWSSLCCTLAWCQRRKKRGGFFLTSGSNLVPCDEIPANVSTERKTYAVFPAKHSFSCLPSVPSKDDAPHPPQRGVVDEANTIRHERNTGAWVLRRKTASTADPSTPSSRSWPSGRHRTAGVEVPKEVFESARGRITPVLAWYSKKRDGGWSTAARNRAAR